MKGLLNYQFNLGQLTIWTITKHPGIDWTLSGETISECPEAEAVVQFAGNQDADFHEVYEKMEITGVC